MIVTFHLKISLSYQNKTNFNLIYHSFYKYSIIIILTIKKDGIMNRLKIVAIIAAVSMLAGCGEGKSVETSKAETVVNKGNYASEKVNPTPAATPVPTQSPTPVPTPVPIPTPSIGIQPGVKAQNTVKLDTTILDKLDNKKLSWWITLNKNHQPTTVPSDIKSLIDNHGGIYQGDTSKKVIYLTFDEGYENGYTAKILDTLKKNNVKALFFVTGPYVEKQGDLIKRMLDEGHQVGNHSINHPSLPTLDYAGLEKELLGLEKQFSEKFGKGFKYMRPPMGEYSQRVLEASKQVGYKTIFWSYAFKDYDVNDQKGADYAYKMVMDNLHNGAVYLLHAVSKDNAEALDRIIQDIKAQGYEIRPFDL